LLGAVKIVGLDLGFRISRSTRREMAQPLLNALPELFCLSAQFGIAELLHLGFEGTNGPDLRHQTLDDSFVLGPKDLAN
jgi:hypothetical protein